MVSALSSCLVKRLQLWALGLASGFRISHCFYWDRGKRSKREKTVYQNLTPGQIRSDYLMNLGAKLDIGKLSLKGLKQIIS